MPTTHLSQVETNKKPKLSKADKDIIASLIRIDNCCFEVRPSQTTLGLQADVTREHVNRRINKKIKKALPIKIIKLPKKGYKDQTLVYNFEDEFYDFQYRKELAKIDPRFGVMGPKSISRATAIYRKKITQQNININISITEEEYSSKRTKEFVKKETKLEIYQNGNDFPQSFEEYNLIYNEPLRGRGRPPWVRSDEEMFKDIAQYELEHPGTLPPSMLKVISNIWVEKPKVPWVSKDKPKDNLPSKEWLDEFFKTHFLD